MSRAPLPDPRTATAADIAEGQRRYDMTFNALAHADYLSPVAAYQRQLARLRVWLAEAAASEKRAASETSRAASGVTDASASETSRAASGVTDASASEKIAPRRK